MQLRVLEKLIGGCRGEEGYCDAVLVDEVQSEVGGVRFSGDDPLRTEDGSQEEEGEAGVPVEGAEAEDDVVGVAVVESGYADYGGTV